MVPVRLHQVSRVKGKLEDLMAIHSGGRVAYLQSRPHGYRTMAQRFGTGPWRSAEYPTI